MQKPQIELLKSLFSTKKFLSNSLQMMLQGNLSP